MHVMPFVEGESLRDRLYREQALRAAPHASQSATVSSPASERQVNSCATRPPMRPVSERIMCTLSSPSLSSSSSS